MNKIKEYIQKRKVGLIQEIFVCIAMFLTCGFYQMEGSRLNVSNLNALPDFSFLPGIFQPFAHLVLTYGMDLIRILLAICLIFTLITGGFFNGVLHRWGYTLAIIIFMLLPQLGLIATQNMQESQGFGRFLYELFLMIGMWPYQATQKLFLMGSHSMTAVILAVLTGVFFAGGWLITVFPKPQKKNLLQDS